MDEKKIRCIICPLGCTAMVKISGTRCYIQEGYKCKQGLRYAENEALHPKRIVTTSVLVDDGEWPLASVKSSCPVPKNMIFPIMEMVQNISIKAPVSLGQIIIENVLDTNADIVSTKNVKKREPHI